MFFVIFCIAIAGFYMHTSNKHEPKKLLTKNQKGQRYKVVSVINKLLSYTNAQRKFFKGIYSCY